MLDKSRPYDIAGSKSRILWRQDGVYYEPGSGKVVDATAKPAVVPNIEEKEHSLTCKLCGAVRQTAELFHEHLLAVHRDEPGVVPNDDEDTNAPKDKTKAKRRKSKWR